MTDIVKNVASNARPQINIKRKKIVKVQEGHTGAWKVAYADFVSQLLTFQRESLHQVTEQPA